MLYLEKYMVMDPRSYFIKVVCSFTRAAKNKIYKYVLDMPGFTYQFLKCY